MINSDVWLGWVPIVIAALALASSFILGSRAGRTARRALEISERTEARRAPKLGLYVNESVSWRDAERCGQLLGFHVIATNPTDQPSALVNADLHVMYAIGDRLVTVKVPHGAVADVPRGTVPIELPGRIGPNDAVSGWFLFLLMPDLVGGNPIERYDLIVRDIHDVIASVQVTVFREVSSDEAEEERD